MAKFTLDIEASDFLLNNAGLDLNIVVDDIAELIDKYCAKNHLRMSINATIYENNINNKLPS